MANVKHNSFLFALRLWLAGWHRLLDVTFEHNHLPLGFKSASKSCSRPQWHVPNVIELP